MTSADDSTMEGNYQVIQATRDGKPALLLVNAGLDPSASRAKYPWLITLQLPIRDPNELGLCDRVESDRLSDVEDALLGGLETKDYCYVGRVTWDGSRDVLFYVADPDRIIDHLNQRLEHAQIDQVTVTKMHDPEWVEYGQYIV